MLRAINYILYGIVATVLIFIALANREVIRISLVPEEFSFIGYNFQLNTPIFFIFFAGFAFGIMVGFILEWTREYKLRSASSYKTLELNNMKRQIQQLKCEKYKNQDDVLALLDDTKKEIKKSSVSA